MNCPKCGFLLTENDQFCKNCGAPVNAQEEQTNVQQPMNNQPNFMGPTMDSQPDPAPMNSQPSPMQPLMNNQPEPIQPPINTPQPVIQSNNLNDTQNSWGNNSSAPAPEPQPQPAKSGGKGIYIVIALIVVAALVAAGVMFGPQLLNGNNNGSGSNGGEIATRVEQTYTVRYQGFTFKIPTNLIYETGANALYIGDEQDTWQASIEIASGSFTQLQANKNQLITIYQKAGYSAANLNEKTYGGLNFVTIELTHSGQNAILGIARANSMYMFGVTACSLSNEFDYNILSSVAKVLSTAEYSGETNNMSGFEKPDMSAVSDLAK